MKRPSLITTASSPFGLSLLGLSLLGLSLSACSTATLIGANIDMASFVPATARSQTVPLPAVGNLSVRPLDDKDGNPNNGFLISSPIANIDIIEAFSAEIDLKLGSSSQSGVKLEMFIAPDTATDVYLAQYAVASDEKIIAAGGRENLIIKFDLQANGDSSALAAIKSGKFRLGLNVGVQTSAIGSFSYVLNKANAGVKGYPAKLIAR
jgi:hypothetical protein